MISINVESLFPSIPVPEALDNLRDHLVKIDVDERKRNVYTCIAKLCMDLNFFKFRGKFYHVQKGTSMGNPLSPMIAEAFMSKFETNLNERGILPRVWFRCIDDVFAIVKKSEVEDLMEKLNCQSNSINFTCENECDGRLAFLDV